MHERHGARQRRSAYAEGLKLMRLYCLALSCLSKRPGVSHFSLCRRRYCAKSFRRSSWALGGVSSRSASASSRSAVAGVFVSPLRSSCGRSTAVRCLMKERWRSLGFSDSLFGCTWDSALSPGGASFSLISARSLRHSAKAIPVACSNLNPPIRRDTHKIHRERVGEDESALRLRDGAQYIKGRVSISIKSLPDEKQG